MRLKSFTAKTLPEAMQRVRDALGPNAVILSTQAGENGAGVRVTAALEDSPLEEFDFLGASGGGLDTDAIGEALSYHRTPPGLYDRLIGAAIDLPARDTVTALAGALDAEFAFASLPAPDTARPIMLVGPPGAGKTATAAKLCARARLAGAAAALVTMDTVKSGGLAQARTFAEALRAHLAQAAEPAALAPALGGIPAGHFTVIDTTGANPFDDGDMARLREAAELSEASVVLVLPAGGDVAESAEAAYAFAAAGARALISTRLDAARRFGGVLTAAQAGRFALMAAGASPHIGDPLHSFTPVSLARLLMPDAAAPTPERDRPARE
ncbi:MAG: hypothetical protein ACE5DS_08290, partial [Kiloniellaceae bacterium]